MENYKTIGIACLILLNLRFVNFLDGHNQLKLILPTSCNVTIFLGCFSTVQHFVLLVQLFMERHMFKKKKTIHGEFDHLTLTDENKTNLSIPSQNSSKKDIWTYFKTSSPDVPIY